MARLSKDLCQVDVATKATVRLALVSDLENGATTARLDTVTKILAALDLDLTIVQRRKAEFDPTEY
jgi:HTH-type transcriptional regulator / antitoxin HipB